MRRSFCRFRDGDSKRVLTMKKSFDIVKHDELPKTAGAEKRKEITPAEERIVMNCNQLIHVRNPVFAIGFFNS